MVTNGLSLSDSAFRTQFDSALYSQFAQRPLHLTRSIIYIYSIRQMAAALARTLPQIVFLRHVLSAHKVEHEERKRETRAHTIITDYLSLDFN